MSNLSPNRPRRRLQAFGALAAGGAIVLGLVGASPAWAGGPSPSTLSVSPGTLVPNSTGNTLTFTYGSGNSVSGGTLTITFPTGFSNPSGVTSSNLTNCTNATPTTQFKKIVVSFSCAAGGSFQLTAPGEKAPKTPGTYTFGADTTGAPITSLPSINVTGSGPTAKLKVTGLPAATDSEVATSFTLTAKDAYGNVTPGYTGTVKFASTDPRATLPGPYTFTSTDAGSHTFTGVLFYTPGHVMMTAADVANGISGSAGTTVSAPTSVTVAPTNPSIARGATEPFTATASYADGTTVSPDSYVIWSTDTPSVATINKSGVATGVSAGTATISATLAGVVGSTTLSVTPAATMTQLASSSNPSVSSQTVTFTATVTPTGAPGPATGTVTFTDGSTTIGTGALSSGVATLTTSALTVGTHPIVATYNGDANNQSSSSSELDQVVNAEGTTTSLTSDQPGGSTYGQSVTFTATVSANSPGVAPPNGFVSFTDSSGDILANVPVGSDGTASFATSSVADPEDATLPAGNDTITATFIPTNSQQASSQGQFVQTVNQFTPSVGDVVDSSPPYFANQPIQVTATVTGTNGVTPTGSVTWSDGVGDTWGPVALSSGSATGTITLPSPGTYNIVATYTPDSGSPNYSSANDSPGVSITAN